MADPLPISLVAHTVFCRRRAWLEAVGESPASIAVEHGVAAHAKVDARADERRHARRSVEIVNDDLGLTGRCDVVSGPVDALNVVEYKSSPLRRRPEVTEAQRVQLALQGLCLESMGHQVSSYSVYFTNHRKEVPVSVDDDLRAQAVELVDETRQIVTSAVAPEALDGDPR